jgi:branched-chain amino acid transport system permease protein
VALVLAFIGAAACLPFLGISFLDTPNASYSAVLVHPIAMFVLMALGLNIVVGKSGMLDLGYVALFAISTYAMGILGVRYSWNTWEVMPVGILLAMFAGFLLGFPTLQLRRQLSRYCDNGLTNYSNHCA